MRLELIIALHLPLPLRISNVSIDIKLRVARRQQAIQMAYSCSLQTTRHTLGVFSSLAA
jgi:hypothetical protein